MSFITKFLIEYGPFGSYNETIIHLLVGSVKAIVLLALWIGVILTAVNLLMHFFVFLNHKLDSLLLNVLPRISREISRLGSLAWSAAINSLSSQFRQLSGVQRPLSQSVELSSSQNNSETNPSVSQQQSVNDSILEKWVDTEGRRSKGELH